MRRTHWLSGWKLTGQSARAQRRRRGGSKPKATESLEVRTLLTTFVADEPLIEDQNEAGLPDNVWLTQEPGYFEVAVQVPSKVFDIDWPSPITIQTIEPVDNETGEPIDPDMPILIDLGGIQPLDDHFQLEDLLDEGVTLNDISTDEGTVSDDFVELTIEPLIFPPVEIEFDPGQDILVSVGMFGLPIAEMFGGELPDEEGLNDFLENGPSEDGFLATLLSSFDNMEPEGDINVDFDLADFFGSSPLVNVALHDDGIEVSASLYQLMLEPPHDIPFDYFGGPFDEGFGEDDGFADDPVLETDDESGGAFPDELIATVQVDDLPIQYAPEWLVWSVFETPPFFPETDEPSSFESDIQLSRVINELHPDFLPGGEGINAELLLPQLPDTVSFESSVPVGQLMAEALFGAVFYTLDSNPMFEFAEPPEDFEPDFESFEFTLGVHLLDFGEPDEDGQLPDLGIDTDYEYAIALAELFGTGEELAGNDEPMDEGEPTDDTLDDVDDASNGESDDELGDDGDVGGDTTEEQPIDEPDGDFEQNAIGIEDQVLILSEEELRAILIEPVPISIGLPTTIRLSLEFVDVESEGGEIDSDPSLTPETTGAEAPALVAIEFGESNVQLNEGTLTIDLPETEDAGWTATASGDDLIIDFESNEREETHTISLAGATALVINGTQFEDFVELDLTDIGAADLESVAVHGGEGDDSLDLIGAAANRFSEVLLTGGVGHDVISVGLTRANVILRGGDGDDLLFGGRGDDEIFGGAGNDLLDGGGGHDQLHGGRNDDVMLGGGGHDSMWGGAGDDRITGHSGRDRAFGGSGNDTFMGGKGHDRGTGGSGDDHMDGGAGRDTLRGGAGRDKLMGRSGNDRLFGGADEDTLDGSSGRDLIKGGLGDDEIRGGKGNDRMFGGRGRDRMFGSRGNDRMDGGEDIDSVYGNDGDDTVAGLQDDDVWQGGRGGNFRLFAPGHNLADDIDLLNESFGGEPEVLPPEIFLGPPDVMPFDSDEPSADSDKDTDDIDEGFENFDEMVDAM